jgi:hypothetical protein
MNMPNQVGGQQAGMVCKPAKSCMGPATERPSEKNTRTLLRVRHTCRNRDLL